MVVLTQKGRVYAGWDEKTNRGQGYIGKVDHRHSTAVGGSVEVLVAEHDARNMLDGSRKRTIETPFAQYASLMERRGEPVEFRIEAA